MSNNMSLEDLHKKFHEHLENQSKNWKSLIYAKEKGFYQGYDALKIDGWRPSEKRFVSYGIESYLSMEKTALDIGSNCGFFTLHVSNFLKNIHGVEINPFLISIGNDAKNFLKVENTFFHNSSFEDFKIDKKFNVIFSLANDSTIDKNTQFNFYEYIEKIVKLLDFSGILIFECQAADMIPISKFTPKFEHLKKYFKILEEKRVPSEYPVNVPERILLVLEKL